MVVAALTLATLSWSCGGDETPPATEASPPASVSPAEATGPGARYRSMDALAAALAEGGFECTDLNRLEQDNRSLKDFALCDPDRDPLQRVNIYLFENSAKRNRWMGSIVESGLPWLFGPNWIVVGAGEPGTAEQRLALVQDAIGGQIAKVQF